MTPMIPACLPPRDASRPKVPLPPNACDTHAHVFGPAERFRYADDRSYTPPDAPLEKYLDMLDSIGFARGVLVQGSAHGRDNSAMLDALAHRPDRLRGVAVADADVSPDDLRQWASLGVRGLRFNHFFRDGQLHYRGGVPLSGAERLAPVMAELGWHLQLWIDVKDLPETITILKSLGLPVVIDHMAAPMPARARRRKVSRVYCARSATAGAGPSCRAPIASAATRRIIPTRGHFTKRWCEPIRNAWCGAATGRIRALRARCPMPDICSNCSNCGRRTRQRSTASS
jgi:Amidohydrolase